MSSIAPPTEPRDERILVLPGQFDDPPACSLLEHAGLDCCTCSGWPELFDHFQTGVGILLFDADMLDLPATAKLRDLLDGQPPWSDIPIIVVVPQDQTPDLTAFMALGNIALLQRPLSVETLTTAVRSCLSARRRQYEVRDLLRAVNELLSERRAADRRKDEFLAMLAHELRNPLAPIRSASYLIKLTAGMLAPSRETLDILEATEIIERQVAQLTQLIDDLLDVARITAGKILLRPVRADLVTIVSHAVALVRLVVDERGHQLVVRLPDGQVPLDIDPLRIEQVVGNLITNAAKYSPVGSRIEVAVEQARDMAVIRVNDNGPGIEPALLPHVFELFVQSERSLDRSQGGLGIGLTVVRSLVELHGGTVVAHSAGKGLGTEFVVTLPASRQA